MPSDTIANVTVQGSTATGKMALFPASDRVIYDKNPLVAVVCNIRFDPILRIESQPPADFQEALRDRYPSLREQANAPMNLPSELPPQVVAMIKAQMGVMSGAAPRRYDFVSADEQWVVTLTKDSLSLTSKSYKKWEDFRRFLELPMGALIQHYSPAFFTRVSLRYQNLIQRSKLGLTEVPWRELLKPQVSGMMAQLSLEVAACQSVVVIGLGEDRGQVRIQHGLVRAADKQEESYLIDNDFYVERRIATNETLGRLDFFHAQSGSLFRWCVDTRLDKAMEPQSVK